MNGPLKNTAVAVALLLAAGAVWMLRGEYDRTFMLKGVFHVTSTAHRDLRVELLFPSGGRSGFLLPGGGSHTFVMKNTGEGGIQVRLVGEPDQSVGYVTTLNAPCVIAIGDSLVTFSQLFPGLADRQLAPATRGTARNNGGRPFKAASGRGTLGRSAAAAAAAAGLLRDDFHGLAAADDLTFIASAALGDLELHAAVPAYQFVADLDRFHWIPSLHCCLLNQMNRSEGSVTRQLNIMFSDL